MKICVFDTETTSINKPFVYNIGYALVDTDTQEIMKVRDYVVEQVWHNAPLFCSAYYAEKRPIYVSAMKGKRTILEKFGYICRQMSRDFKEYGIEKAFAYNSPFDEKVFDFNCDWFKVINPFDNIPIVDIRGFAHHFIVDDDYKKFCDENGEYTDSGNYSTTAETMTRYLNNDTEFNEEHTALADSLIETDILLRCLDKGADINTEYSIKTSIPKAKSVTVYFNKEVVLTTPYKRMTVSKDKTEVKITT